MILAVLTLDDDYNDDYDDGGGDDDDLYIIGAVCLSVCNENAYFPYSRDLVVSLVSRHF